MSINVWSENGLRSAIEKHIVIPHDNAKPHAKRLTDFKHRVVFSIPAAIFTEVID